jgi:hypothetical protein
MSSVLWSGPSIALAASIAGTYLPSGLVGQPSIPAHPASKGAAAKTAKSLLYEFITISPFLFSDTLSTQPDCRTGQSQ